MKIIKILALTLILFIGIMLVPTAQTIISEANIPSETNVMGITLEETTDIETMRTYIVACDAHMNNAHEMAEAARGLNYPEDHIIIVTAKQEYNQAWKLKQYYSNIVNEYDMEQKRLEEEKQLEEIKLSEYPNATQVWNIMKSYGWSDIICAGIMGNMMRECGGDTFNLNPYAGTSHYGLCQWSKRYHGGAWGKDIAGQLEYLKATLDISIFNGCTTPEKAAEKFCWSYERPASSDPVHKRINNARRAYEYFCG